MKYDSKRLLEQLIFKYCLTDNKKLIDSYGWLKRYYKDNDDNLFYSMNKLPFVTNVVKGFKEGFLSETLQTNEEFYKYIQIFTSDEL
jgi:hypothetical protein